ncbi:hypothetical protein ACQVQY_30840 [Bacillus mycoides]
MSSSTDLDILILLIKKRFELCTSQPSTFKWNHYQPEVSISIT